MVERSNRRYHDRIAAKYDRIYEGPYWRFYRDLSWRHAKAFLPKLRPARALDLGCGTGWFGLRLLKSGFDVVFLDPSGRMLAEAREGVAGIGALDRASFVQAEMEACPEVETASIDFATAQGDPLSFCKDPGRGLRELRRVLKPRAQAVLSVDHRAAGVRMLRDRGEVESMLELLKTGRTRWLARKGEEAFGMKMFDPTELEGLCRKSGFEVLSLIGKTCLVQRDQESWLEDGELRRRLLAAETRVHARPAYLGLAAHLQIALRRTD